ncbi:hypothetical protein F5Y16DRAFT_355005 [Xylariaceae sp. FL0255]|nr:hypothetical protein F5Y16DRAFT_355005 [Xylariaceae sp. FL0255]
MAGFALDIKRRYQCNDDKDLQKLIPLGHVEGTTLYNYPGSELIRDTPRGVLERGAEMVPPPPKGQNIRALVDGVSLLVQLLFGNR